MSCLHPNFAIYNGEKLLFITTTGQLEEVSRRFGHQLIEIPCGKCIECRKAYAKEKALRCACEAKYSTGNFFITLTYENPIFTKEQAKKDQKNFIDQLRKENPNLRYFACCEKGDEKDRIHHHINFFNLKIDDGKFVGIRFKSKHLEQLWGKGLIDIKPFDPGTAQYTAGYTAGHKKKTLFISQSRNLGGNYVLDHKEDILTQGGMIHIGTTTYKMGRWGYKILEKFGSVDVKPLRKQQGEQAHNRRIDKCKELNMTYSQWLANKMATLEAKRRARKGGDNQ